MKHAESRIKNISTLLKSADKNLRKAQKLLETMSSEAKSSFDDVPGTLGTFDGTHMVDADGKKYEVNPNYVAKSLLLVGDNLKMVEEGDKKLFKQVTKVDRKRLEGVLNKKEGKWYALTDSGSYRILDVAIEFRRGEINDEATILVPEENLNSEWGALEKMAKDNEIKPIVEVVEMDDEKKEEKKPKKKTVTKKPAAKKPVVKKPAAKKPVKKKAPIKRAIKKKVVAKKPVRKPAKKPIIKVTKPAVNPVESLMDDDDLR